MGQAAEAYDDYSHGESGPAFNRQGSGSIPKSSQDSGQVTWPYTPHKYQMEVHQSRRRFSVLVCHRRWGKALALDTPVPMADGSWKTMGDIVSGDQIIGSDGQPCNVIYAHDVLYNRDCYEVEFTSGEVIVADGEHLWSTTRKKDRHNPVRCYMSDLLTRKKSMNRVNMPKGAKARTTREIYETLESRGEKNHRIQLISGPAEFPEKKLPVDPYLLGLWLGDGSSRCPEITTMDHEVVDFLKEYCLKEGWNFKKIRYQSGGKAFTYRLNGGLHTVLRENNLLENKHVPEVYLISSTKQRKELLKGLMDTDGSINKKGNFCEITQKNTKIAKGIERLLCSLGMVPHISIKTIDNCEYIRLKFRPHFSVFKIKRKSDRYSETPGQNLWQSIIRVDKTDSVPVRCLTVDSKDHQFCVGEKFTVTHNTVLSINELLLGALRNQLERPRYAYIAPQYKQAKQIVWDYAKFYSSVVPGVKWNESELRVDLPGGGRVMLLGAENPDSIRGIYLDGVVMDEVAQMNPDVWYEVVRPTLTDRQGWALFIGTPKGRNLFYDMYQYALSDPTWYAGMFRASETDIIPGEELEQTKKTMSESKYLQEMECSFEVSGDDLLVPLQLILAAKMRDIDVSQVRGRRIAGLDVARYGNDKSALVIRQDNVVSYVDQWQGKDTMETTGRTAKLYKQGAFDHVYVDVIGIGSGVVDRLKELGVPCTGINVSEATAYNPNAFKLRDDLWLRVREFFEMQQAVLPDGLQYREELINEISGVTFKHLSTGRVKVASKDEMRRNSDLPSPNLGDSLCLTFADMGGSGMGGFKPKRSESSWWR